MTGRPALWAFLSSAGAYFIMVIMESGAGKVMRFMKMNMNGSSRQYRGLPALAVLTAIVVVMLAVNSVFLAELCPVTASRAAFALDGAATDDWYEYGYEKGQYDAMYTRPQDPDYWDNNGSAEYYEGYSAGYESVNWRDWFGEGLANGQADKTQGYPYQPLAWPNDGSPNYYAGYDSGYYGTPINWYHAGWYNGLNDARYGLLYRPDIYFNNGSDSYYEGYYDGYYGSFDFNAGPPGTEEQNDHDAQADTDLDGLADTVPPDYSPPGENLVQSFFQVDNPSCIIEGKEVIMEAAPYASAGRVFVPLRYLAYMCGLEDENMAWLPAEQKVTLHQPGGNNLVFTLGMAECHVNGQIRIMEVAPETRGQRVYLPARTVAENLGFDVEWEASTRTVRVFCGE